MEYKIAGISLSGIANRDLVRDDVTFKIHSITIQGDVFRVAVLHMAPQGENVLEDVAEFDIAFADAPSGMTDAYAVLQTETERHLIETIYTGAIEKGMI